MKNGMMEPLSNVGMTCKKHAPKPMGYEGPLEDLIGKFVERGFTSKTGDTEHMWVKVVTVEDDVITGVLDNDPLFVDGLICGDETTVERGQIEAIYDGEGQ